MLLNEPGPCFFCLGPISTRLGLDRKGRPYLHCACCGARSFLPSFSPSLHGIPILGPLALAIHDEMSRDRDAWERRSEQIGAYLLALRAELTATASTPQNERAAPTAFIPVARPA
jgi:hypothetical protein